MDSHSFLNTLLDVCAFAHAGGSACILRWLRQKPSFPPNHHPSPLTNYHISFLPFSPQHNVEVPFIYCPLNHSFMCFFTEDPLSVIFTFAMALTCHIVVEGVT